MVDRCISIKISSLLLSAKYDCEKKLTWENAVSIMPVALSDEQRKRGRERTEPVQRLPAVTAHTPTDEQLPR